MKNKHLALVVLLLTISLPGSAFFGSQTNITSNQSVFKKVTAVGSNYVIVDNTTDLNKFGSGDTIIIIQMKGLACDVNETPNYGYYQDYVGAPGKYEFAILESVNPVSRQINLVSSLINSYSVSGNVQIIKVPSYGSAVVQNTLTCPPWDSISKTGGLLVFIVERSLKLNADIDASGKGFAGGSAVTGNGICTEVDPATYNKYSYTASFNNSGCKGESMTSIGWVDFSTQFPIYPVYSKGKGANGNGGGGGNGRFSGGGGGSNYGTGGKGGRENNDLCVIRLNGGLGGISINTSGLSGNIFAGGGGGGSTSLPSPTSSSGGKGGGIIIILCTSIDGNGYSIKADGATPSPVVSGNAGAGGGGGGGSVVIYTESFKTSPLTLSSAGGSGGNTNNLYGEGGGGGGGLIFTNLAIPGNVAGNISGGSKGINPGSVYALNGSSGSMMTNLNPVLNHFFFNTIWSAGSRNRTDSIISGNLPPIINGSTPVSAAFPVTYQWQKRYEGSDWTNIPASNSLNYTPVIAETSKVYFRRVITDNAGVSDTSKAVEIRTGIITAIESHNSGGSVILYPNPATFSSELIVSDLSRGETEIYIFDTSGRKISSFTAEKETDEFRYLIPLAGMKTGVYFVKVVVNKMDLCTVRMIVK